MNDITIKEELEKRKLKLYTIYNATNSDTHTRTYHNSLSVRDFIINHLDLSLNWSYKELTLSEVL